MPAMDPHHSKDDPTLDEAGGIHELARPRRTWLFDAELIRVVDGDTIEVQLDCGVDISTRATLRLPLVDTPEPRGKHGPAGRYVTERLQNLFGKRKKLLLDSRKYTRDSFQRIIAHVWLEDLNVSAWLLENGLAWPTDSEGKPQAEKTLANLAGIPQQIKEEVYAFYPEDES